jgi:hypothetical protein
VPVVGRLSKVAQRLDYLAVPEEESEYVSDKVEFPEQKHGRFIRAT